jgi:hypothetical protein
VWSAADEVAKGGQQLEKNGSRMGFGVRSDGTDNEACWSIKGGFAQYGIGGQLGQCERWLRRRAGQWRRIGIELRRLDLRLGWEIEEIRSALLQAREGGKGRASYTVDCISQHVRNYHGSITSFKRSKTVFANSLVTRDKLPRTT